MFYNRTIESKDTPDCYPQLRKAIDEADTIIIGAGAGLSTSAGFVYAGERFDRYFSDFSKKYGFKDMYSGGFVVMRCPPEELWAFWSRNIYINRYMNPPKPVYETVVLLRRKNIDDHLEFTWTDKDFGNKGRKATYPEIQSFILDKYGLHVSHLNIAQIKRKCGIIERENYNLPKNEDSRQPNCTPEKEDAIMDAFRHFKLI